MCHRKLVVENIPWSRGKTRMATHSRLKPLRGLPWMVRRHEEEILNYFKVRIFNGIVGGLNNKTKVISHRAYGFHTVETYKLALYHCMGKLRNLKSVSNSCEEPYILNSHTKISAHQLTSLSIIKLILSTFGTLNFLTSLSDNYDSSNIWGDNKNLSKVQPKHKNPAFKSTRYLQNR